MRRAQRADAVRITTAASSKNADIAQRQRRYVISMLFRTACFIAAVLVDGWLRWVLVVAALLLPYVAVVMANAANTKSDAFLLRDAAGRPALGARSGARETRDTPETGGRDVS